MTDPKQIKPSNVLRQKSPRSMAKARIASALCLLPGIYCTAVVLFALRNAGDYATALPQFLRYIAIPAMLALVFAWVAVRGSRVLRVNLGGAATVVLALLFASEARLEAKYLAAVSDLFGSAAMNAERGAVPLGLPSGRTVKNLNQKLGTVRLEQAVVGGIPFSQVNLCTHGKRPITYRADRYGFRNPEAVYANPIQLLVIGDSFVEGICLPEGQDLMARIRARQQQVAGLGIRGAGPLLDLAMLGRYGPVLRPPWTVIAFYEGNDWEDLGRELRVEWLREGLRDDARFGDATLAPDRASRAAVQIGHWESEPPPDRIDLVRKTHTLRNFLALHQTWTQLGLGYPKVARPVPEFGRALARAQALARSWNGRLALAYIPQTSRYVGILPDHFVYDRLRSEVAATAKAQGIPLIDLTPVIAQQPRPIARYAEGHFNAQGAELSAAAIMTELDRLARSDGGSK